jgi:hypothetical protein
VVVWEGGKVLLLFLHLSHFFSLVGALMAFLFHFCPLTLFFHHLPLSTTLLPKAACLLLSLASPLLLATCRRPPYNLDLLWFIDGFSLKPDILSSDRPRSSHTSPSFSSTSQLPTTTFHSASNRSCFNTCSPCLSQRASPVAPLLLHHQHYCSYNIYILFFHFFVFVSSSSSLFSMYFLLFCLGFVGFSLSLLWILVLPEIVLHSLWF